MASLSGSTAFLDIYIGDETLFNESQASYEATVKLLLTHAAVYGLPSTPEELSEEQRGILEEINQSDKLSLCFNKPPPLLAGRLIIDLDSAHGLSKTRTNFLMLCTGEKGFSKNAPTKKLHYLGCPIHRVEKGFVAQGGDVTRGDGSGGESIFGPKFNDDKAGLKIKPSFGSVAMANSGKNSNSSQFFIVLTEDSAKLSKLAGKYVVFGQVRLDTDSRNVLEMLEGAGTADGRPSQKIWVGDCGIL
ncbi:cyclophilin-like domain-containing protein [Flagelloscypha sp. PMI_526]|nr:cyclophilin-like domain-containing protein [Flagelloscypha sp. PMI_526]